MFLLSVILIVHTQENMNTISLAAVLLKLFVLTINSVKKLFFTEEKTLLTNLLLQMLLTNLLLQICHMTGKYRGAAHWSCNVNFKIRKRFL